MGIAKSPSKFTLPQTNPGVRTVLEYLRLKFPRIAPELWQQRMHDGKVHWHDGRLITAETPYQAQQRVYYYREVADEPSIPFSEHIVFEDEHLLVAFKPHFLALTPGGIYVNECLQQRLRNRTGNESLQALHRLDRVTAGLVLFAKNTHSRARYHDLFAKREIHKTYQAVARVDDWFDVKRDEQLDGKENSQDRKLVGREWVVKNHMSQAQQRFRMQVTAGAANTHSVIRCLQQKHDRALFELEPVTGKTHQLRVHMQTLGYPILNDKYYPTLQDESADDYNNPLQLLAQSLKFTDPLTQQPREFHSGTQLTL